MFSIRAAQGKLPKVTFQKNWLKLLLRERERDRERVEREMVKTIGSKIDSEGDDKEDVMAL